MRFISFIFSSNNKIEGCALKLENSSKIPLNESIICTAMNLYLNLFHLRLSFAWTEIPHFPQILIACRVYFYQYIFVAGVEVMHIVKILFQLGG